MEPSDRNTLNATMEPSPGRPYTTQTGDGDGGGGGGGDIDEVAACESVWCV
jgi:hypothetical protein